MTLFITPSMNKEHLLEIPIERSDRADCNKTQQILLDSGITDFEFAGGVSERGGSKHLWYVNCSSESLSLVILKGAKTRKSIFGQR